MSQQNLFDFDAAPVAVAPPPPQQANAISLWQPWAMLWALGERVCETRHWAFPAKMVGQTIYIHAAQKWEGDLADLCAMPEFRAAFLRHLDVVGDEVAELPGVTYRRIKLGAIWIKLPMGAMIGRVRLLADLHAPQKLSQFPEPERRKESKFGDFSAGRHAWVGGDHQVLAPIPHIGRQGFFFFDSSQAIQHAQS